MLANSDTGNRRTDDLGRRESVKYSVETGHPVGPFWRFDPSFGFLGRLEGPNLQAEMKTGSPPEVLMLSRPCCFGATEGTGPGLLRSILPVNRIDSLWPASQLFRPLARCHSIVVPRSAP